MSIEHADFDGIERLALVLGGDIASTFDNPGQVRRDPAPAFVGREWPTSVYGGGWRLLAVLCVLCHCTADMC